MDTAKRLTSLDILRGFTIAGMIIVNDPGSWSYVYPPLRHASWHGITPTDFVFPFFLFIVGVSIVFALTKRQQSNAAQGPVIKKIVIRTAMIFGMGMFLAISSTGYSYKVAQVFVGIILIYGLSEIQRPSGKGSLGRQQLLLGGMMLLALALFIGLNPDFSLANIRIPGVLQRIALVFLACAILFLKTTWRTQAIIGAVLLIGYWLLMAVVPVPIDEVVQGALASGEVLRSSGMVSVTGIEAISENFIAANVEPGVNLQAWIDRMLIPGRIYEKTWDPEGLLSTLPAIGGGITGMMAGHIVLSNSKKEQKANHLFVYGFCLLLIGNVWDWFFPFNKNLWSSSFVMYTSGLSTLTFAALYWLVDLKEKGQGHPLFSMGKIFGANAITAYVLHSLFARIAVPVKEGFMSASMGWGFAGEFASLLWALIYTFFIFLIVWVMYKRKLFLKL